MGRANQIHSSWKTIRVVQIAGTPFVLQQQYDLWLKSNSHNGGHAAFQEFPDGAHRLLPLMEIIDNEEEVMEYLSDDLDMSDV